MNRLVALPSRRVEAWRYSDLAAALDERDQIVLRRDSADAAVTQAAARGGTVAALAAQAGATSEIAIDTDTVRIERPRYANLEPRFTEFRVAAGARLTRVVLQNAVDGVILDCVRVTLERGAAFRQFVFAEGARLARIETIVDAEEGASVELNGLYAAAAGRHADLTSLVTHKGAGGATAQLVKGVADAGGRGVFQGKIVVERCAQKTDARQRHSGMLLSEGAEIFAKPELMIHADDVACAHGNTIGGLDEAALFYLRSRGVPANEARALLTEAFLLEAVPAWLEGEVRAEIEGLVAAWVRART